MASVVSPPIFGGYHIAPAAAPTVTFSGTGGLLGLGNYQYAITFVTTAGESAQGTASIAAAPLAAQNGVLTAIPTGQSFVTARKVYRTVSGGAQLKLVATINDNTTTTYTDSIADGSLGANIPVNNAADSTTTIAGTLALGGLLQETATNQTAATFVALTANGSCGLLTFTSVTVAAATSATVTVTCAAATANSLVSVVINAYSGTWVTNGYPIVTVDSVAAGSFVLRLTNTHAANALSGTLKVYYNIVN